MNIPWKQYPIPNEVEDAKKKINELFSELNTANMPRLLWFVQDCAEGVQAAIEESEQKIIQHEFFHRVIEAEKQRENRDRLIKNITLLGCLRVLITNQEVEKSAIEFAKYLKNRK